MNGDNAENVPASFGDRVALWTGIVGSVVGVGTIIGMIDSVVDWGLKLEGRQEAQVAIIQSQREDIAHLKALTSEGVLNVAKSELAQHRRELDNHTRRIEKLENQ